MSATHTGMTSDEFDRIARDWFATARHPRFNRPYTDLAYQPMVELLGYLRANGFKTYLVSGGGIEFMRVISEQLYGIPPEQVIGSSGKIRYEPRDGAPVIVRLPELDFFDDKEGKPVAIQKFIGRRPIAAFGNSDGDQQMLQWTAAGPGRRLMLLVDHTDAEREFVYRVSPMGRLEHGARRGPPAWLDGRQHEGRLEAHFCLHVSGSWIQTIPTRASSRSCDPTARSNRSSRSTATERDRAGQASKAEIGRFRTSGVNDTIKREKPVVTSNPDKTSSPRLAREHNARQRADAHRNADLPERVSDRRDRAEAFRRRNRLPACRASLLVGLYRPFPFETRI